MKTIRSNTLKLTIALLLVAVMFGAGFAQVDQVAAACSPTITFDLYAKTGTANLFGSTNVNIWGYSLTSGGAASLPGPALVVNQGDCVQVTLHNALTENSALLFQGQGLVPDTTGAPANGTQTYSFTATNPGTFLYEAGLIPGKQHQVAMGLYGALVINSASAGTAYGGSTTAFNAEKVLVLSEFDPNLAAAPTTFDMRNYAPRYFLINGKAYASGFTGDISVNAGDTVLLRYVNAGLQSHAMSTLGIAQKAIASDGQPLAHPHSMVAETIATGQTLDTLVSLPAIAPAGTKFAVYDANLMLRNSSGFGGMLTFLSLATGSGNSGDDTTGPLTSMVALAPNLTNGSTNVSLTASVSDSATGNANVVGAEYFIDAVNANGSGTALSGVFGAPTVSVGATLPTSLLSSLASGTHTIYVHGQDAFGNWGAVASATLSLDKVGPTTSALGVSPNPTNGTVAISLSGTASDSASGNSNIAAAEYMIDGGIASLMTVNLAAPTAGLSATISATTVNALSQGTHTISVRSQDALGNWGSPTTITLNVDKTAPTTSSVVASPNPNNGSKPYNTSTPAVRITASFSDSSTIAAAEGFLDTIGTTGTGFVFIATDGLFNNSNESGYSDIPLAVVGNLTAGSHTIYVHAKDVAGNWGAMSTTALVIDKTPPTAASIVRASTNPTNAATVQFTVNFSEAVVGVNNSNFTLAQSGGLSSASIASIIDGSAAVTVTVNTGTGSGTLGLNLTSTAGVTDLAGNALLSTGIPMTGQTYAVDKTAPTFTSVSINPTSIPQGTASINMTINGSADTGGSGLANAGEYWFDTASIPTGTGTAFTGTSGISVATGSLTTGSHTLRVRIRDNAGNWSVVRTATLTVTSADVTPPTVVSIVRAGANPASASSVNFTVTFSESVTNVSGTDFSLAETLSGSTSITVSGSGTTRTVSVTTGNSNQTGTLGLNVPVSATINDLAGNAMTTIGLPFIGEVYNIDKVTPTVSSINRVTSTPTNLSSVQFLVTFSESVTGVTSSNFTVATSGGVSGASIASVVGSGNTRTVTVNTGTGSGTLGLNKTSNSGIADSAGNTLSGGTFTGQTYTIDKTAPTVASINRNNATPTSASSVSFTVTFSESVTGVASSNFTLTTTGTFTIVPTITSVTGSGATRTVTINTGTGVSGATVRLDMVNSTGVADTAGNAVSNVPFTTGQSYTKS